MQGKVVLVTGGARGIGAGIARTFAEAGAEIAIGDLAGGGDWTYQLATSDELAATVAALRRSGRSPLTVGLDVTDPDSCQAAVAATLERFGRLDVLVNNAGVVDSGPIESFPERAWERIFDVNVKGLFLMSRAALDALSETRGSIVITASIAGKRGYPNMTAYCASKFAAIGFTQSLAAELAPRGVRVNAVCPGMLGTAMWLDHLLPEGEDGDNPSREARFEALMAQRIPLGRPQTPADIGGAALYLAGAENVTGVALSVSGGFEMG